MISRLRGTLLEAGLADIVVDVQGVGFSVLVPMSTVDRLPRVGETITLFTVLSVREDALTLYGFATTEERSLFSLVMGVSGIGPRTALNILSAMPVGTFCGAVSSGDVKGLSRINGIGKRSAERLIVELKDKVSKLHPDAASTTEDGAQADWDRESQDAIAALVTLGFRAENARKTVRQLRESTTGGTPSAAELIRKALAILNS